MSFGTAGRSNMGHFDGTQAQAAGYLRQVGKHIRCSRGRKAEYLEQLKESISLYLEEHPAATPSDIAVTFGTPEEIAQSFIEETDPKALRRTLESRQWFRWALLAAAILIAVAAVVLAVDFTMFFHGHFEIKPPAYGTYYGNGPRVY